MSKETLERLVAGTESRDSTSGGELALAPVVSAGGDSSGAAEGSSYTDVKLIESSVKRYLTLETVKGRDGKSYRNLILHGFSRGQRIKVDFVPFDVSGWHVLDLVFANNAEVELVSESYVMHDKNGKVQRRGYYYYARSEDDEGVYQSQIKPKERSDQDLLNMVLLSKSK